jgi:hypothetical protein
MVCIKRSSKKIPLVLILFLMMIIGFKLTGQSSSNYNILKDVISSAGVPSSSVNFELIGAMGQPSGIGEAASTDYSLSSGFFADLGVMTAIGTEGTPVLSETLELYQNYPNPFKTETTIAYSLPEAGQVKLEIYNILGEHLATVFSEYRSPGIYSVDYNGTTLAPGVYIYKMQTGQYQAVKMMNKVE